MALESSPEFQSLRNFSLPHKSEVPQLVKNAYKHDTFPPIVRKFHLDRLPAFKMPKGIYVMCPYCSLTVDRRSLQIDHIIPVRVYSRYMLYAKGIEDESLMESLINDYSSDKDNLLLCCSACNSKKGDRIFSSADYNRVRKNVSECFTAQWRLKDALKLKLYNSEALVRKINKLVTEDAANGGMGSFIMSGTRENVSAMTFRGKRKREDDDEDLFERKAKIQRTLGARIAKTRPAWPEAMFDELTAEQPSRKFLKAGNDTGLLCFYCLGLFSAAAFHIDHIHPTAGRTIHTEATYNEPQNLLPVCRTCNTAKGARPFNSGWFDYQIKRRQDMHFAGFEDLFQGGRPSDMQQALDYAKNCTINMMRPGGGAGAGAAAEATTATASSMVIS